MYDLEWRLPGLPAAAADVFQHDNPFAKQKAQTGSEHPNRRMQYLLEQTGRLLLEVEFAHVFTVDR